MYVQSDLLWLTRIRLIQLSLTDGIMFYVVLALQNLEATGSIKKAQELEWVAMGGSLSMMSKGSLSHFLLFGVLAITYILCSSP